jgi:hypothetical protein
MLELLIAIGFNIFVAALTALLIYFAWTRKRTTDASLADADTAMSLFRDHFPDTANVPEAARAVTLTTDRRNALIELPDGAGVGLLQGHGRRWNARVLQPGDIASVRVSDDATLRLKFTDYSGPRALLILADADERAAWLARLQTLTQRAPVTHGTDPSHA